MTRTTAWRRFALVNLRVYAEVCCASNAVVASLARPRPASVEFGRMLVSISLDALGDRSAAPLDAPLVGEESVISAVPSRRQNASLSSVSTRLHEGQRFIVYGS